MKVLVTDPIADVGVTILRQCAQVDIQLGLTPEEFALNYRQLRSPCSPQPDQSDVRYIDTAEHAIAMLLSQVRHIPEAGKSKYFYRESDKCKS